MKLKKVAVWGFLVVGVLYVIAGMRDIFAPGFLNMSPRIAGNGGIVVQFILAGVFFGLAALNYKMQNQASIEKK